MSVVTNLMLSCSCTDHDQRDENPELLCKALRHVRSWCLGEGHEPDRDRIGFPETVDKVSGGTKHMECNVYAWGANYLDLDGFLEAVASAPWRRPECVQVFARGQDDDRFVVYNLREDRKWAVYGLEVTPR